MSTQLDTPLKKTDDAKTISKKRVRTRGNLEAVLIYKAVLLDIEGTTTPISFVRDILFPFVRKNLHSYFEDNWLTNVVKEEIEALKLQAKLDLEDFAFGDGADDTKSKKEVPIIETNMEEKDKCLKEIIANVNWQMDNNRKTTALKQLQGHIWETAYASGDLKGEIYSDVLPSLEKWKTEGIKMYIYSSGSVEAQKLLFGYSDKGDLLHFFSGHFDTKVGSKLNKASYEKIANVMNFDAKEILFLTDNIKEAKAAKESQMQVSVTVRPGNEPLTNDDTAEFTVIYSFNELFDDHIPSKKATLGAIQKVSSSRRGGTVKRTKTNRDREGILTRAYNLRSTKNINH